MVIYFSAFYEPPRLSEHMLTSDVLSAFAARDMALFPPLNVSENDKSITIRALIPGATLCGLPRARVCSLPILVVSRRRSVSRKRK